MKALIFSDVHGSIRNVQRHVGHKGEFDLYIFLGDIFGYLCDDVLSLVDFFKRPNVQLVLGNHDMYYLRRINRQAFESHYSHLGLRLSSDEVYENTYGHLFDTCGQLDYKQVSFLYGVPLDKRIIVDGVKLRMVHGSIRRPFDEYVYPDGDFLDTMFEEDDFDVLCCGHTHKPFIREYKGRYIVNPGSCTLPRGKTRPSVIHFDTNPSKLEVVEIAQYVQYRKLTSNRIELTN